MSTHHSTQNPTMPCFIGAVTLTGPTSKGYFRLRWTEPDGTPGDTTAGRDLDAAIVKATDLDRRIGQASGPRATCSLSDVLGAFIADGHSPYKDKKRYKQAYLQHMQVTLGRGLRGMESVRAMDLDRAGCDRICQQSGTTSGVSEITTTLRSLLRWGYQNGYFTPAQVELLPRGGARPAPARPRTRVLIDDGGQARRARMNGQHPDYIAEEDCPDAARLARLGASFQEQFPLWGELACEFAAGTGARWGEQFQLTAPDVHLDGCHRYTSPHVHINWQIDSSRVAGEEGRALPKGNKTRVVPIPKRSITGYRLRRALRERIEAARNEQLAGANPQALLFPAERGGLLWHTSFSGDHLLPAMIAAGLPVQTWMIHESVWDRASGRYLERERQERHAVYSWHSLRHRFARTCVDLKRMREGELMAIGGWENIGTVQTRYYRSGEENMRSGLHYFD